MLSEKMTKFYYFPTG